MSAPRLLAAVMTSALLLACSKPAPEADSAQPPSSAGEEPEPGPGPAPAPEPEPEPEADAKAQELTLVPSELDASEDGSTYEYCLDCQRKSATYTYCSFDKAAFDEAVGAVQADAEVTLTVKMVPTGSENSKPDDPNAPQPDGGFTHLRHRCSVEAVQPAS